MAGLYIHIPFCKKACNYCDFHFSTQLKNKAAMIDAICKEIKIKKNYAQAQNLSSIYLGGGTPSLLSEKELEKIIDCANKYFLLEDKIEVTLEANPDDINAASLKFLKKLGVNRLSIGLQSFNNEELKWMNRAHTAEESSVCVKMAQDNGFENISIDLIYGSKFQTVETWQNTLKKAIDLDVKHISSYNLTIEHKTALGLKHHKGLEPAINDELSSSQFLLLVETLNKANFIHYEISNFGRENYFAVHNSNYWLGQHYIGVGPSAHSFNGDSRQWNIKNNQQYIDKINSNESFFEIENLTIQNKYNEYILTRLRTIWGCDINEMKLIFGKEITDHFENEINNKTMFVEEKNGIYTLNNKGKLLADGIAADLFL